MTILLHATDLSLESHNGDGIFAIWGGSIFEHWELYFAA